MVGVSTAGSSARSWSREKGATCFEIKKDGEKRRVRVAQDIEHHWSDAVTVNEPDAREYADALPELPLPGSGDRLADCGDDIHALFCTECGNPVEVGRTCRRSRCPRCWQSWDFKFAVNLAANLHGLAARRGAKRRKAFYKHHITVSPHDSTRFNSKDPIKRCLGALKMLLHQTGVDTGYFIYHPYRIAPEYRGDVLGHESGDGNMTWKDVLEKVEHPDWSWEAVKNEFLVYAPHFHVLCISDWVDGFVTEDIEDQTGVVIHRIVQEREDGKQKSLADLGELCRATAYSLSHAGLAYDDANDEHRAVVRPFGEVANFEVWDSVKGEVKAKMREVAPDVLGCDFAPPRCSNPLEADDGETDDRADAPAAGAPAVRSLSPSGSCDHDHGPASAGAGVGADDWARESNTGFAGGAGGAWDVPASYVPEFVSEPPVERLSPCGGKLAPMSVVDDYLADDEWRGALDPDDLDRLHEAREEWERQGRPEPSTPPPPD